MILYLLQTGNGCYSALFDLIQDGCLIGRASMVGSIGSPDGKWCLEGKQYHMSMEPLTFGTLSDFLAQRKACNCARPYVADDGSVVFLRRRKEGLFKPMCNYVRLENGTGNFESVSIGFGKDGVRSPLLCGEKQVALVESSCVVQNDLHRFRIAALDTASARAAIQMTLYRYTTGAYVAGKKVKQGIRTYNYKTANKTLLRKYDPEFLKSERNSHLSADDLAKQLIRKDQWYDEYT